MKKWKMLNRLGMEKHAAKIAAYLLDNEGLFVTDQELAEIGGVAAEQVPGIVAGLLPYMLTLAYGESSRDVYLFDLEREKDPNEENGYQVNTVFPPVFIVTGPEDGTKGAAENG